MADQVYPLILEAFAQKLCDWVNDDAIVLLVTSGYAYSAAHQYISDIGGANIVARSGNLASKTATNGVLDADDITVTAVSGSAVTQLILAFNSGADATSRLVAKLDSYTGLPLTPGGGDVPIVFPNDANKIMKL